MSKTTKTSPSTEDRAAAIAASLTPKGREFMRAVGAGEFSFFDGGIKENEGSWGNCLSEEHFANVRSASGVMNATKKAGLWDHSPSADQDGQDAGGWWSLTADGAAVALYLAGAEQAVEAPLAADKPTAADSSAEPVEQPEKAADWRTEVAQAEASKTLDWKGNYNTVFAPAVAVAVAGSSTVQVAVENVSTMLRRTHLYGAKADVAKLAELFATVEAEAQAALRTWQKTQDRKDQTDMEKFNQNRSFLSGYLGAVAQSVTGAKKTPVVPFAKDMDKALRPEALKAGATARKTQAAA